jgi:hypothetical protein
VPSIYCWLPVEYIGRLQSYLKKFEEIIGFEYLKGCTLTTRKGKLEPELTATIVWEKALLATTFLNG